jgi:hypothetical protein
MTTTDDDDHDLPPTTTTTTTTTTATIRPQIDAVHEQRQQRRRNSDVTTRWRACRSKADLLNNQRGVQPIDIHPGVPVASLIGKRWRAGYCELAS